MNLQQMEGANDAKEKTRKSRRGDYGHPPDEAACRNKEEFLDQQQAVSFLNEGDRAYIMWMQMMYAGENYIKSVLVAASQSSASTLNSGPAD